jgi:hypothetical protein
MSSLPIPAGPQASEHVAGDSRVAVSLFLASVGFWVGAALFFSAGVLPVLFMSLEPSEAGRIAALLFPVYFRASLAIGIVACIAAVVLARGGGRRWKAVLTVLAVMTLVQAWSTLVVHPEMAAIRGASDHVARFQQLHVLSVRLNGVVLAGGLALVAASGFLFGKRRA